MKNKLAVLLLAVLALAFSLPAQTALNGTTLSAAIGPSQTCFSLASVTNVASSAPNATGGTSNTAGAFSALYIDRELMTVTSVSSTGNRVCVLRGVQSTPAAPHASGAVVIVGPPSGFYSYDPQGFCGTSSPPTQSSPAAYTPWINKNTGNQWLCSSVSNTWVPGFGNPGVSGVAVQPTAASAISSNAITPSGPMIHVTGTTVLKTITVPATMQNGSVTIVFDGSGSGLTWDATGNINVAGTSTTAGSAVTFTYDRSISKWVPSRLA